MNVRFRDDRKIALQLLIFPTAFLKETDMDVEPLGLRMCCLSTMH